MSHCWTRRELALIGFEYCADMKKMVHVLGDAYGTELIRKIDADELSVEDALKETTSRRQRGEAMERSIQRGAINILNDRGRGR